MWGSVGISGEDKGYTVWNIPLLQVASFVDLTRLIAYDRGGEDNYARFFETP